MPPEPCAVIENTSSLMINQDDFLIRLLVGKQAVLQFLGHELGSRQGNCLELFAGPGVQKDEGFIAIKQGFQFFRRNQHAGVVFLAFEEALKGGVQIDLMIFANLLKSFIELVGAGLAAPNVEGGEEGSPCSRVLVEN